VNPRRRVTACCPVRPRGSRNEGRFLVEATTLVSEEGCNPRSVRDGAEATTASCAECAAAKAVRDRRERFEELGFAQR
jgi:hypothetical protein